MGERDLTEFAAGLPPNPKRIGLVVEDVDGKVWALEFRDVQNAGMRIDYPRTQSVPMNLPTQEFAKALARAMQTARVQLSFTSDETVSFTSDETVWKTR